MTSELSVRERQKRDRRQRILDTALRLFEERGFQETTVLAIAKAARVSRGTVFNYFPYKEAILLEHLGDQLRGLRSRVEGRNADDPVAGLYAISDELACFVEGHRHLVLPLSYELLNPDPERSRRAFEAVPLAEVIRERLQGAAECGRVRRDYSLNRLARTIANTYFLTALQWASYRQDRSVREELRTALTLALEGIVREG